MHNEDRDKRDSLIYDPVSKGFDASFFATLSGTPAASGGKLQFNNASVASFMLFEFVNLANFTLTVPAVPTSGDARRWGFYSPATTAIGALYFDITGTAFTVNVVDSSGNLTSKAITWSGAWTNTQIVYGIAWEADRVQFWVNGAIVATFAIISGNVIPFTALPLYIKNGNADNLTVAYLDLRRIAGTV